MDSNTYKKLWKAKRIAEGLCYRCGKPRTDDRKICAACNKKSNRRAAAWRERVLIERRCTSCGEPLAENETRLTCSTCAAKNSKATREKQKQAIANGLCEACQKNPIGSRSSVCCDACYEKRLVSHRKIHSRINFGGLREAALERDNHVCRACGSSTKLEVHHLDGNRQHNELSNFITLCHNCHVLLTRMIEAPNLPFLYELVKVQMRIV